jgi:hypothetical protein
MISHPVWKTSVYPATIFTTAPVEAVRNALNKIQSQLEKV